MTNYFLQFHRALETIAIANLRFVIVMQRVFWGK